MAQRMSLVGLDVHASQTHAAVLDMSTGELRGVRLRMAPGQVVEFLATLPGPVRAVYEAGPTGFGLARAARQRGIDVQVVAAGKVPRASGDRVKTDKRDAERLARLLAAGELRLAFEIRWTGPGSIPRKQRSAAMVGAWRLSGIVCSSAQVSAVIDTLSAAGLCAEVGDWHRFIPSVEDEQF